MESVSPPSNFSAADSSIPASASDMLVKRIEQQNKEIAKANLLLKKQKDREIQLLRQLATASQKSPAISPPLPSSESAAAQIPSTQPRRPSKRKSPGSNGDNPIDFSQPSQPYGPSSPSSDDEVPDLPAPKKKVATPRKNLYQGLHSILCSYKSKKIKPGTGNLTFSICAEICGKEADSVRKWTKDQKVQRQRMIISALHLVYKDRKESWFQEKRWPGLCC